ncbi:DUF3563 family protein [Aquincola sp. MAHUQ-54]|uniref:DUF3563 family protein n=1 Tax=Aquincola agrisoli TaxID=3119538 RepID=A0AAW9Q9M9_9BURK
MNTFFQLVNHLFRPDQGAAAREEAYLAESVDIYDLERRMRELDDRRLNPQWGSLVSHGTA